MLLILDCVWLFFMYFSIFFPANRSHPRGHLLLSDTNRKEFKWVKEHTAEIYNNGGFDVIKVDKVSWNKMEDSDTYEGGGGEGEGGGYFSGSSALLGGGVYSWSCCKTQQLKKKKKPNKTFWLHKFNLALYPQAVRCDWGNRVEDSRFDVSERISYTSLS